MLGKKYGCSLAQIHFCESLEVRQKFYCFISSLESPLHIPHLFTVIECRKDCSRDEISDCFSNLRKSFSSLEHVVNQRLSASLDAGHIVAHVVEASLGGVDLNDNFELALATGQLVLPVGAVRLTVLDDGGLGVLTGLEHLLDVIWLLGKLWVVSVFVEPPAWGDETCDALSHCLCIYFKLIPH